MWILLTIISVVFSKAQLTGFTFKIVNKRRILYAHQFPANKIKTYIVIASILDLGQEKTGVSSDEISLTLMRFNFAKLQNKV